ncbi:MAG TPA: DNA polymerase III subunit gamma/tau [Pyrinomonadaceae bacterium]|nr:DNA polymerase III subunit gamma/tau [Pyrinomonadaceae bacterium]
MSYQVIARKWRPQAFDEVTGQEPITQTLRNAIEHSRLHHAYLFSGARGVGKTTTARLLAKALNCHKTDKPNIHPCRTDDPDQCPSCREIAESRSMDVLEIDAASHTGIDAVRDTIIEGININPVRDRYKVFIIDEVHQLSKPAFNALLKTLEEPPPNVMFVMATTELHKVPDTILSRCQQFEFRTIPLPKIFDRLKVIAETEKIDITDVALREIARSGEGSMRDAQSNFDQVISFSDDKIDVADVTTALGIASTDMLVRVVRAISAREPKAALDVVEELIARGHDLRNYSRDLLGLIRDLLVFKIAGGAGGLTEGSILTADEMKGLAELFSEADLIRFFNSLAETETKLKDATQPRFTLEIGLVKLVEMGRVASVENLLERLSRLASGMPDTAPKSDAAAAASEKKTLISDEPPETPVLEPEFPPEPDDLPWETASDVPVDVEPDEIAPTAPLGVDLSFLDTMPVKLPPMDPEELEHVDDTWLDSAYENKLLLTGDDLLPIANAAEAVRIALPSPTTGGNGAGRSRNGAAAAIAAEFINRVPEPEVISSEVPVLPENATDAQLREYAEKHPTIRKALKIFRGKIVEIHKT